MSLSLDRMGLLQNTWCNPDKGKFTAAIHRTLDQIGFTEEYLELVRTTHGAARVIKDGVWGMLTVDPVTAQLLDCPILQRLRWIRQLGFSYLVYPSAEHSRFPHSLGVYHVVHRFVDTMRANKEISLARELVLKIPTESEVMDVAHAAILHDIGHLPFSHVCESAIAAHSDRFACGTVSVDEFLFAVEECLKIQLKPAEGLSLLVILSDRFRRYYQILRPQDQMAFLRVACLVAGLRTTPDNRALPDMISSGLDADKIDYLCRDSDACKIPLGIDVTRVFLRSLFLQVPFTLIPAEMQHPDDVEDQPLTVFVVNPSGLDTVEEITLARAQMYRRVYYHKTTRNAERLFAKCLESILPAAGTASEGSDGDILQLWTLDDSRLLHHFSNHSNVVTANLAKRLMLRRLPRRAAVLGSKLIGPSVRIEKLLPNLASNDVEVLKKQLTGRAIEGLRSKALTGRELRSKQRAGGAASRSRSTVEVFEQELFTEIGAIKSALEHAGTWEGPAGMPSLISVVGIPNLGHSRVTECFVLESNDTLTSSREFLTSTEQADAVDINAGFGFVFCDDPWRAYLLIALRDVLYDRVDDLGIYHIDIPFRQKSSLKKNSDEKLPERRVRVRCLHRPLLDLERTCRRAKVPLDEVKRIRSALERCGYYDKKPRLAEPVLVTREIKTIAEQLADFSGQHGWKVTPASVAAFIGQFPPSLRVAALNLVRNIELVGRSQIAIGFQHCLATIAPHATGRRFLVGLSRNSGAMTLTLLEQELREILSGQWTICGSVSAALDAASADDTIVFCDDNCSSGTQASTQLRYWMGIPKDQWPADTRSETGIEEHALSEGHRKALSSMSLHVAVYAGTEEAKETLAKTCEELGLRWKSLEYMRSIEGAWQLDEGLKAYLEEVGTQLLAYCRWSHDPVAGSAPPEVLQEARRDSLGYRGKQGLLATWIGVPASTITALWCPGIVDDAPWVPLFIRRGYFSRLVLG